VGQMSVFSRLVNSVRRKTDYFGHGFAASTRARVGFCKPLRWRSHGVESQPNERASKVVSIWIENTLPERTGTF
jgi:hypothetical protein